jgi:hypothetical protein
VKASASVQAGLSWLVLAALVWHLGASHHGHDVCPEGARKHRPDRRRWPRMIAVVGLGLHTITIAALIGQGSHATDGLAPDCELQHTASHRIFTRADRLRTGLTAMAAENRRLGPAGPPVLDGHALSC